MAKIAVVILSKLFPNKTEFFLTNICFPFELWNVFQGWYNVEMVQLSRLVHCSGFTYQRNFEVNYYIITIRVRTCTVNREILLLRNVVYSLSEFLYLKVLPPLVSSRSENSVTSYASIQREDPEFYGTPFFFFSNRTMVTDEGVVCSLSTPVPRNPILFWISIPVTCYSSPKKIF